MHGWPQKRTCNFRKLTRRSAKCLRKCYLRVGHVFHSRVGFALWDEFWISKMGGTPPPTLESRLSPIYCDTLPHVGYLTKVMYSTSLNAICLCTRLACDGDHYVAFTPAMAPKLGVRWPLGWFKKALPRKRADQHPNIHFEGHPCCVVTRSGGKIHQQIMDWRNFTWYGQAVCF